MCKIKAGSKLCHLRLMLDLRFIWVGEQLVSDVTGTKQLEEEFTVHASIVKRYFSTNGQQVDHIAKATKTVGSFRFIFIRCSCI
jgi:hypothetical protein